MSLKRVATSNLNHENWNQEDPSDNEKAGTFTPASKETMEKRVIRQAKRRCQPSSETKNVFSGFAGFNKPQPSSFDFLANLTNGSNNANGAGTKTETAVTSSLFSSKPTTTLSGGLFGASSSDKPAFGASTQNTSPFSSSKVEVPSMTFSSSKADSTVSDSPVKSQSVSSSADSNTKLSTGAQVSSTIFGVSSTSPNQNKSLTNSASKQPESSTAGQNSAAAQSNSSKVEAPIEAETDIEKARNKYYSRLKGLNESVSSWIVKHVEKTPLCFLSPIFKDYENYLKEIQEEYEAAKAEIEAKSKQATETKPVFGFKDGGSSLFTNKAPVTQDAKPNQVFGTNATSSSDTSKTTGLFGQTTASNVSQSTSNTTTPTKGFSFGATSTTNTNSSVFTTNTDKPGGTPSRGFSFGLTSTPSTTNSTNASSSPSNTISPLSKGFSFGVASTPAATPPKNTSSFTLASGTSTSSPGQGFSFGMMSKPATTSPTNSVSNSAIGGTPFSFGTGKPFSFSTQTQPKSTEIQAKSTETQNEDDEDQPPKVEHTHIVEENSVFEKKCKIFVKRDGNYADKGIGTLYVKKIPENGKHQLLVRADTNLGTVLLNLLLSSAIPTQRMGKNNVMLVCIPTPDAKPPPTPVLIRVKTGEEADQLLETLNKYKS